MKDRAVKGPVIIFELIGPGEEVGHASEVGLNRPSTPASYIASIRFQKDCLAGSLGKYL